VKIRHFKIAFFVKDVEYTETDDVIITLTTIVILSDDVETRLSNDESCMDESQDTNVET